MNEQVTKYITESPPVQRALMEEIRALIFHHIHGVKEQIKWGRPVYSTTTDFAYFKTTRTYLTLGFFRYHKITTNVHLLEGTGKDMRHIKLRKTEDLNRELLVMWLREVGE